MLRTTESEMVSPSKDQKEISVKTIGQFYNHINKKHKLFFMFVVGALITPALSRHFFVNNEPVANAVELKQNPDENPQAFQFSDPFLMEPPNTQFIASQRMRLFGENIPASMMTQQNFVAMAPNPVSKQPEEEGLYKGIPIKHIYMVKRQCVKKSVGHSEGQICTIDGIKYYMKAWQDEHQNALLGAYNIRLIKNLLGITVPNIKILSDGGILYFGSIEVTDFVSASTFKHLKPYNRLSKEYGRYRDLLVEKIGEDGIAKFMVAATFIQDLKLENWGYDKNGLVLIDLDIAPRTFKDFFTRTSEISTVGISLSFNNILQMHQIYTEMLTKPLPSIDQSVDLPLDVYQGVLSVYINACNDIINHFSTQFPSLTKSTYSNEINERFVGNINKLGQELMREQLQAVTFKM